MTSDEPPPSAGTPPGDSRRRKAPTIELTATEVEGSAPQAAQAAPSAGAQSLGDPEHAARSEDVSLDQAGSAAPRRTRWLPDTIPWPALAAGAVAGAIIAQLFLVAGLFIPRDGDVSGLDARLARVEGEFRAAPSQPLPPDLDTKTLAELTSRLAKLEAAAAAMRQPASDAASANRLSTIEGDLSALTQTVGILGRRSDEVTTAAREARQRADATAAALAELTTRVKPGAADVAARDKIAGEVATLSTRLAAVERAQNATATELAKRAGAETRDKSGRFAVAATALHAAIEQGRPFTAELAAVQSLAPDPKPLAPLEPFAATGVPTSAALARELSALIPSLVAAAAPPPREESFLEKLQANAEKLVRIRPLEEAAGSDPAAIVARIEVKAVKGDLAGALAELAGLPPPVRAPADAWIKKAQARSAAVESSHRLAADALAGLGK
jgi:hypothetical protein